MAKSTGLGAGLFVSGNDLSGDIGEVSGINGGNSPLVVTGIDKSGVERLGGPRDAALAFSAFFNDAATQAHPVLSALPTADRIVTYYHRTTTIGDEVASLIGKQIDYDPTRGNDGSLTITTQALANGSGLEWGESLTVGKRTDTGATVGATLDYGATVGQTLFGAQAYLHVFAFTGTDATVVIEDSTSDFAAVTLLTFTEVSALGGANTSERIETASRTETVDRFLRVTTTTSGGFSNLVFAVQVTKNQTSVVF
jgi:hypothetical protein